jgi:DNA-binding NarL/FixJ family response regulator
VIRAIIVDDHPVVLRGIRQIIDSEKDIQIVGEVESGKEAMLVIPDASCDVVILDIALPDVSGLLVLSWIKSKCPQLPVLMMSIHDEQQYAVRALKAGASGYIMKDSVPQELIKALRKIAAGGKYISSILSESLALGIASSEELPHEKMSEREFQIFHLIVSGNTLKEIGEALCISGKTVSTHRRRILEKMNMKTNTDLIIYALRNKLID